MKLTAMLLPYAALAFCTGLLVFYRLKRRFGKDRNEGKIAFLDHNLVELLIAAMFIAVAAPDWADVLTKLAE